RAVAAARGDEPFDVLLTGGTLVDVGCGELRPADVGIVGPLVASLHERGARSDALDAIDCTGLFVAPGFVDMHVHFESSMLTAGVPRGGHDLGPRDLHRTRLSREAARRDDG